MFKIESNMRSTELKWIIEWNAANMDLNEYYTAKNPMIHDGVFMHKYMHFTFMN